MRTHNAMAIAVAALGLLVGSSSARAARVLRVDGGAVTVPAGGYLYCEVTVTSQTVADASITLLDATGVPVPTEFGSSYRASPLATGNGLYFLDTTAGVFGDPQNSVVGGCQAAVEGRRGVVVDIQATAHDGTGAVVEAHVPIHVVW